MARVPAACLSHRWSFRSTSRDRSSKRTINVTRQELTPSWTDFVFDLLVLPNTQQKTRRLVFAIRLDFLMAWTEREGDRTARTVGTWHGWTFERL